MYYPLYEYWKIDTFMQKQYDPVFTLYLDILFQVENSMIERDITTGDVIKVQYIAYEDVIEDLCTRLFRISVQIRIIRASLMIM